MNARDPRALAGLAAGAVTLTLLAGCGSKSAAGATGAVAVTASENKCQVAAGSVKSGRQTFAVSNEGSGITEVYVYASGDRVVGEVENVGPATKRNLSVDLVPGDYEVACKPGMVGNGMRSTLHVTGAAVTAAPMSTELTAAVVDYRRYVTNEVAALLTTTQPFVAAVKAGDLAKAKSLYAAARTHYERIEPIAESFGDLDALIDERIDDVTDGRPFVGFHRLEHDLWKTGDVSRDAAVGDQLLASITKLQASIGTVEITPLVMANGAKSLLDEVAKSKVTGEEERYSHLDLVDFAANVEGSQDAYTRLRPVLVQKDPALVKTLDDRFASMGTALSGHATGPSVATSTGTPYVLYTTLSAVQVKALAVEVDDLSEPLGQLAAALPAA